MEDVPALVRWMPSWFATGLNTCAHRDRGLRGYKGLARRNRNRRGEDFCHFLSTYDGLGRLNSHQTPKHKLDTLNTGASSLAFSNLCANTSKMTEEYPKITVHWYAPTYPLLPIARPTLTPLPGWTSPALSASSGSSRNSSSPTRSSSTTAPRSKPPPPSARSTP